MEKTVVIVGAGFAGISAAFKLAKNGAKVLLIEKELQVGGLSKSIELNGRVFEIGPHVYFPDKDEEVELFWEAAAVPFITIKRKSLLYIGSRWFISPIRFLNAINNLGIYKIFKMLFENLNRRIKLEEVSSESWFINKYGISIYREFFEKYSIKFWGVPPSHISKDWTDQRLKKSLIKILSDAKFGRLYNEGKYFRLPVGGSRALFNSYLKILKKNQNFELMTGTTVTKIDIISGGFCLTLTGGKGDVNASHLIFTGYLDDLENLLNFRSSQESTLELGKTKSLRYRSLLLICLVFHEYDYIGPDVHWMDIHDDDISVIRVTNFRRYPLDTIHEARGYASLSLEYNCFMTDLIWNYSNEELLKLALDDLMKLKLIRGFNYQDYTVKRFPRAYPIYDLDYRSALRNSYNLFDSIPNLFLIGRNGQFRFDNTNQAVRTGLAAAEICINSSM